MGDAFSLLLVAGGAAVLFGTRLVVVDPARKIVNRAATPGREREPLVALRLSVLAAVLWSSSLLMISDALEEVDALTAAALRLPFFALVLVVVATLRGDMGLRSAGNQALRTLALSGTLVLGSMLLFLISAELAPAGTVAILTSTAPIFAVPMSALLLREQVTRRVVAGTAACMVGILLASGA
jgi:drug/metabolite transporter (DMT)-like permease